MTDPAHGSRPDVLGAVPVLPSVHYLPTGSIGMKELLSCPAKHSHHLGCEHWNNAVPSSKQTPAACTENEKRRRWRLQTERTRPRCP